MNEPLICDVCGLPVELAYGETNKRGSFDVYLCSKGHETKVLKIEVHREVHVKPFPKR